MENYENDRYQKAFKLLPHIACFIHSQNLTILEINDQFDDYLNQINSGDGFVGSSCEILVNKAEQTEFKKALISGHVYPQQFTLDIKTDDKILKVEWTVTRVDQSTLLLTAFPISRKLLIQDPPLLICRDDIPFSMKELVDLFQKAPIGIHCTAGGKVRWANDYLLDILGYEPSEYIGHSVSEFICDPENKMTDVYARLLKGEPLNNLRGQMFAKDGSKVHVVCDTTSFFNEDGSFSHTGTFIRDDMEQVLSDMALQEQLERCEVVTQEKDRFTRIMFHEIRTPLHVLSHSTSTLTTAMQSGRMPVTETMAITAQVDRCLGLVEDLSFAMMFEADKVICSRPEPFALRDSVVSTLKQLHIRLEDTSGEPVQQTIRDFLFRLQVGESVPPCVSADKSLQRVICNLLTNAAKFCTLKGLMDVKMSFDEDPSGLAVEDLSTRTCDINSPIKMPKGVSGLLTFTVTNTVDKALDLVHVNKLFQKYLHAHSATTNENKMTKLNGLRDSFSDSNNSDTFSPLAQPGSGVSTPQRGAETFTFSGKDFRDRSVSSDSFHNTAANSKSNSGTNTPRGGPVRMGSPFPLLAKKIANGLESAKILSDTLISSDGLGLGLYVSYNIVQSLGGLLECSTTDNQACFSFTLPVTACEAMMSPPPFARGKVKTKLRRDSLTESWANVDNSDAANRHVVSLRQKVKAASDEALVQEAKGIAMGARMTSSSDAKSPKSVSISRRVTKKMHRILVVDDSPICRKVLIKSLEQHGFATDFACDGQEACDKLNVVPCAFDAVLMDLRMPIMDGLTATRLCKERVHLSQTPFIVVTAELGEDIRRAAMDAGACSFVSKPARFNELLVILNMIVSPL